MPNTFTQIHIQIIFAVQGRESFIQPQWEEELYRYISGIVSLKGQKMLAINGMPDHIHILIGMRPTCKLSDLVREIKKSSNQFIYERGFCRFPFSWQEGYGAFSYSEGQIDGVMKYIRNQKEHHKKRSFKVEFIDILKELNIYLSGQRNESIPD
ncbi:MAG: IS200/IS605 family transposase [Saprospiraceae bacterium]